MVRRAEGRTGDAETLLREAIAIGRERQHNSLAPNMVELAGLLCARQRFDEATELLAAAEPITAADFPDAPWRPAWLRLTRARCLLYAGRSDAARAIAAAESPRINERWPARSYYRYEADRLREALGG
jgi:hypothetical protein